jgi:histidinol dehydrogenase
VTTDPRLAEQVSEEVDRQVEQLSKRDVARHSIDNYGLIVVTDSLEQSIEIAEEIAPEHLELHVDQAESVAKRIRNAGAIFIGPYAPEAVGDYIAGPSHVLPSGGTARFSSGLNVSDFIRHWSVIYYSRDGLRGVQNDTAEIAESEGFDGHARSARIRFQK